MNILFVLLMLVLPAKEIRYFPSILYGQILAGPGTSKYETVFRVSARKQARARLELFGDKGEHIQASFVDVSGNAAGAGHPFEFFMTPEHPVTIRLMLLPSEAASDVAVITGWATFESTEAIDVTAVVRITTPDGKLITRQVIAPARPEIG